MIIFKDTNAVGEYELSIAKNSKEPKLILGTFNDIPKMNEAYEMIKATLRALNKKVQVVDNI